MLKLRTSNMDINLKVRAKSERGEQIVREMAKFLGVELREPAKKRRKRPSS